MSTEKAVKAVTEHPCGVCGYSRNDHNWQLHDYRPETSSIPDALPEAVREQILRTIEDKFFVAGQMDAQGHAAEKFTVGRGGPVLALSKRLLTEAREALQSFAEAAAQQERAHLPWLTASDEEMGPACSRLPVPDTIDMTDPFREGYVQGYRHAVADLRAAS